jgi:hypothetical protein
VKALDVFLEKNPDGDNYFWFAPQDSRRKDSGAAPLFVAFDIASLRPQPKRLKAT